MTPAKFRLLLLLSGLFCAQAPPAEAYIRQQVRTITIPATHVTVAEGDTPWHDAVRTALSRLGHRGKPIVADSDRAQLRISVELTVYADSAVAVVTGRRASDSQCVAWSRHTREQPDALGRAASRAVERHIAQFHRLDRDRIPNGCEVVAARE